MEVTSLTIVAGANPAHYVVADQSLKPLDPTKIGWVLDGSLAGVVMTSDATGFFFSAGPAALDASGNAVATYTGADAVGGAVSQTFPVTVTAEAPVATVTGLRLLQE